MKKLTILLTVMAMVFVMSGKAQAVPFYYTFSGTVFSVDDSAGIIASQLPAGFGIGSTVTYTFILDFAATGFYIRNDGTVYTVADSATADTFYADYISGDALAQVGGGIYNAPTDAAELNYGYEFFAYPYGMVRGNSYDDEVYIYSNAADASDWGVGTPVASANRAWDSTGASSILYATVTITDIAPVNAVPEPSTLLLLGSGMLGLLAFRRRQLTTQA